MFKLNIPDEDRVGEMLDDSDCDMWALVIWKESPICGGKDTKLMNLKIIFLVEFWLQEMTRRYFEH
ncbi:hypothetical protein OUZ56_011367 [Daphnia magna]|uniref:Uncharacterized protein n=1 Tax=Daphnia magna TaxID=35525 RepID=A0ABQ9YZX6_9CRUS|nr:hypothetical protein OUZ56_011367 [Daphnia magna]